MRMNEIADAEAQLELWKLVNQSVWSSIEHQRQQQAREKEAKEAARRLRPKGVGKKVPKPTRVSSAPKPPPPKKPQPPVAKQLAPPNNNQPSPNPQTNPASTQSGPNTIKPVRATQSVGSKPEIIEPQAPMTPQQMRLLRQKQGLSPQNK